MLAGAKRGDRLFGMEMVRGADDDHIEHRIREESGLIGRAVGRVQAVKGMFCDERSITLQGASADIPENRIRRLRNGTRMGMCDFSGTNDPNANRFDDAHAFTFFGVFVFNIRSIGARALVATLRMTEQKRLILHEFLQTCERTPEFSYLQKTLLDR
jgi:hypothetical protein